MAETVAPIEVSPHQIAHLPGCPHKDDDDYSRWGSIQRADAWQLLAHHPLPCDDREELIAVRRCKDCLVREGTGYRASGRPRIGEQFTNRTAITNIWGGDKNHGIATFPTDPDTVVNIFSDEAGPYPDRRIPGTDRIAYTGQGTTGDQTLTNRGNGYLERARTHQQACRYWHKPDEGQFAFQAWVVIVARFREWQPDQKGAWRRVYVYVLAPVGSPDPGDWPDAVRLEAAAQHVDEELPTHPPDQRHLTAPDRGALYRQLSGPANLDPAPAKVVSTTRYGRSLDQVKAVLVRANDQCENPDCAGMACDTTPDGSAILEVDHVIDLASGGPDHASNMVALCPNCHSAKTRGARKAHLARRLGTIAFEADQAILAGPGDPVDLATH